jgi:hypothetical protein
MVFDSLQIEEGTVDFTPTPKQSRDIIKDCYSVPRTLLMRFSNDGIDETPELHRLLKQNRARRVNQQVLPGTHITPCGDIGYVHGSAGMQLTPTDAVAMAIAMVMSRDLATTVDAVVSWLDQF